MFQTRKLYYADQWRSIAETDWRKIDDTHIAIEASIAFPEGGGQLGNSGVVIQGDTRIRFVDTQKWFGRTVSLPNFPTIDVEGEVQLELESSPAHLDAARPIAIELDRERRAKLTRSHTAAHLVYGGLMRRVENLTRRTRRCSIQADGGRFDLSIDKLGQDDLAAVGEFCGDWVASDYGIQTAALPGAPECRIWSCHDLSIPCGGLHLESTGDVGRISLRRKKPGSRAGALVLYAGTRMPG